jgi:Tfp pilus assembly PilM family ATPase
MTSWGSQYPIAVDLTDGIRATALQMMPRRGGAKTRARMARAVTEDSAPGMSDADRLTFLRDVLRHRAFQGRGVALLPPLETILCYPLRVTTGKDESLEAAIVREARDALPVPIEEAVLDYVSVLPDPAGEKRTQLVLLAAVRKADIERYIQMVRQAGGLLEAVEPAASSLLRAHAACFSLGSKPTLLCHVGNTHTVVVVATRDGIGACRSVPWGTAGLRGKLADNLDLREKRRDADYLVRKHGVRHAVASDAAGNGTDAEAQHSATVAQLLVPLVDELAHELHTVAGYVRASAPGTVLGNAFLYGEGAQVHGLDGYLARELNVDVTVAHPGESAAKPEAEAAGGASYALAFGLGQRKVRWL